MSSSFTSSTSIFWQTGQGIAAGKVAFEIAIAHPGVWQINIIKFNHILKYLFTISEYS